MDQEAESTARAIAFLTAALEAPDRGNSELPRQLLNEAIAEDGGMKLVVGLADVSLWLLMKLEKTSGLAAQEVLHDIARKAQRPPG
jgi:hypothetical protein